MQVGEYCTREVVVAPRDADVAEAARLMREYHVGTVVVVEEGATGNRPVAIVTDRDLVIEVLAPGLDPTGLRVSDLPTMDLLSLKQTDDLMSAMERMRAHGVRRAPVVDDDNRLQGLLSMDDVLSAMAELLGNMTSLMNRELRSEMDHRP
ncbi:MAG: CBS domain-containing protein [Gammaproteobacteria bacterium]|nr:CBS domain-containing protein [Gammaproteobacteria bacterium]